ncbi:MAG: hypothetical protein R3190_12345 [Thermoanaerobaculia bacterium]|nr:hypothetical protein [Thermoanaerobaculia bacterium]
MARKTYFAVIYLTPDDPLLILTCPTELPAATEFAESWWQRKGCGGRLEHGEKITVEYCEDGRLSWAATYRGETWEWSDRHRDPAEPGQAAC